MNRTQPILWILIAMTTSSCQTTAPHAAPSGMPAQPQSKAPVHSDAALLKHDILTLARSFAGQGDPDLTKQRALEQKVSMLVAASPQPSAKDRLPLLQGAWKQVWGPYDYRNEKRGVDPELGVNEIYQIVLPSGCYYNVSPSYKGGDRSQERIGLLRGEYRLDPAQSDVLLVKFTRLAGLKSRPTTPLWELPALAEAGTLPELRNVIPSWIVRLAFGGGALKEVYTDHDLRILFGASSNKFKRPSIYVMTRVP
jgi:hypothetical protein